jgi:hypothetical protein
MYLHMATIVCQIIFTKFREKSSIFLFCGAKLIGVEPVGLQSQSCPRPHTRQKREFQPFLPTKQGFCPKKQATGF